MLLQPDAKSVNIIGSDLLQPDAKSVNIIGSDLQPDHNNNHPDMSQNGTTSKDAWGPEGPCGMLRCGSSSLVSQTSVGESLLLLLPLWLRLLPLLLLRLLLSPPLTAVPGPVDIACPAVSGLTGRG